MVATTMGIIQRLDHLNIVVTDLVKAREFFLLLGFTEGLASRLDASFLEKLTGIKDVSGEFVALHHPSALISIELLRFNAPLEPNQSMSQANQIGYRHLAFAVSNIEQTVEALKASGVEFLSPIQTWEKTGKRLVYFYGPDGILMELAQYPEGEKQL